MQQKYFEFSWGSTKEMTGLTEMLDKGQILQLPPKEFSSYSHSYGNTKGIKTTHQPQQTNNTIWSFYKMTCTNFWLFLSLESEHVVASDKTRFYPMWFLFMGFKNIIFETPLNTTEVHGNLWERNKTLYRIQIMSWGQIFRKSRRNSLRRFERVQ